MFVPLPLMIIAKDRFHKECCLREFYAIGTIVIEVFSYIEESLGFIGDRESLATQNRAPALLQRIVHDFQCPPEFGAIGAVEEQALVVQIPLTLHEILKKIDGLVSCDQRPKPDQVKLLEVFRDQGLVIGDERMDRTFIPVVVSGLVIR